MKRIYLITLILTPTLLWLGCAPSHRQGAQTDFTTDDVQGPGTPEQREQMPLLFKREATFPVPVYQIPEKIRTRLEKSNPELVSPQTTTFTVSNQSLKIDMKDKSMTFSGTLKITGKPNEDIQLQCRFDAAQIPWSCSDMIPTNLAVAKQRRLQATANCLDTYRCKDLGLELFVVINGKTESQHFQNEPFQIRRATSGDAEEDETEVEAEDTPESTTPAAPQQGQPPAPAAGKKYLEKPTPSTQPKTESTKKIQDRLPRENSAPARATPSAPTPTPAPAAPSTKAPNVAAPPVSAPPKAESQSAPANNTGKPAQQTRPAPVAPATPSAPAPTVAPAPTTAPAPAQPATAAPSAPAANPAPAPSTATTPTSRRGDKQATTAPAPAPTTTYQPESPESADIQGAQESLEVEITDAELDELLDDPNQGLELKAPVPVPAPTKSEFSIPNIETLRPDIGKGVPNQAINLHYKGSLIKGTELPEVGPGYKARRVENRSWGTNLMIDMLTKVSKSLVDNFPRNPPLVIANISKQSGGKLGRHRSHQTGLDVDIALPSIQPVDQMWNACGAGKVTLKGKTRTVTGKGCTSGKMASQFDEARFWLFLKQFTCAEQKPVIAMFLDRAIKKHMCEYARANNEDLSNPQSCAFRALQAIKHEFGHHNHVHVRLRCPGNRDCRNAIVTLANGTGC
jgi:murein endopeptidase